MSKYKMRTVKPNVCGLFSLVHIAKALLLLSHVELGVDDLMTRPCPRVSSHSADMPPPHRSEPGSGSVNQN